MKKVLINVSQLNVGDVVISPQFAYGYQAALGNPLIRVNGKTIHFPLPLPSTDITIDMGRFDPSRAHAPFVIEDMESRSGYIVLTATRLKVDLDTTGVPVIKQDTWLQYDLNGERIEIPEEYISEIYKVGITMRRGMAVNWYDFLPQD